MCRKILEVVPDHPDGAALCRRDGARGRTQRRSARADRAQPRARRRISRTGTATSASCGRRAAISTARSRPTGARLRSRPTHANAHGNLGVLLKVQRQPRRGRGRVPARHRAQSAARRRLPQPRRAAQRHRSSDRGGELLLPRADAEAALSGSPAGAGAGLLPARPARSRHPGVRGVAEGRADLGGRQAHAGRVLGARRAGAGVRRVRAAGLRQLREQLRSQAGEAAVSRAVAGGRGAGGDRDCRRSKSSTCSTLAAAPACAARCWRRTRGAWSASISPGGMLKPRGRENGSTTTSSRPS